MRQKNKAAVDLLDAKEKCNAENEWHLGEHQQWLDEAKKRYAGSYQGRFNVFKGCNITIATETLSLQRDLRGRCQIMHNYAR